MTKTRFSMWLMMTAALLASVPSFSYAVETDPVREEKRQSLAHTMADLVISIIRDTKKSASDRKNALEQGFAHVMDIDWIAKFVLGSGWRNATDEQREKYTKLYRRYLTKVYVENYAETSQRQISNIKVLSTVDNNNGTYLARTQVMMVGGNNMKVDYVVREQEASGKGKIIDVIIEGVSLLTTHRAEFSKIAANKGVDGVIAKLEELLEKPATTQLSMK